ncbi:MAG: hypothetical protein V5B33_07925 [Candidatus Accumulibacter sp. UW20]
MQKSAPRFPRLALRSVKGVRLSKRRSFCLRYFRKSGVFVRMSQACLFRPRPLKPLPRLALLGSLSPSVLSQMHPSLSISQLWGVGTVIVWSAVVSLVAFKLVDMVIGLRVPEEEEREGLDITSHGESAYHY